MKQSVQSSVCPKRIPPKLCMPWPCEDTPRRHQRAPVWIISPLHPFISHSCNLAQDSRKIILKVCLAACIPRHASFHCPSESTDFQTALPCVPPLLQRPPSNHEICMAEPRIEKVLRGHATVVQTPEHLCTLIPAQPIFLHDKIAAL